MVGIYWRGEGPGGGWRGLVPSGVLEGVSINDHGGWLDLVVGQPASFLHEVDFAPRLGSDVLHAVCQLVDDFLIEAKRLKHGYHVTVWFLNQTSLRKYLFYPFLLYKGTRFIWGNIK